MNMYKLFIVVISLTFFGCNNSKTSKNVLMLQVGILTLEMVVFSITRTTRVKKLVQD